MLSFQLVAQGLSLHSFCGHLQPSLVDFATTFGVNGSGNDYGNHNRKMPGGVGACGGWGQSAVIAYRQF